jgi:hypothetical protein
LLCNDDIGLSIRKNCTPLRDDATNGCWIVKVMQAEPVAVTRAERWDIGCLAVWKPWRCENFGAVRRDFSRVV